ncbi:adenosylcobinamide-GDP ribazoletransferase [Ottowia sp. VDI28]|uniref:adenosylcobinamide-GDP ribazoletransferase n=1 Tax=unclassified Ottowia TaxID=2645081 RepID=UPI003C30CCFF
MTARPGPQVLQALRHFLLALQFFTRIPITGSLAAWVGYSPAMLRASSAYFPAVGWVVGCVAAAAMALALAVLPAGPMAALAAAFLSTIATVWLTGAFHEDGLADTADGLGGGVTRERALEIMKDSRIGSYGTAAMGLALGLKVVLLALLAQRGAWAVAAALLSAHALSRLAPLVVMRSLPYVSDEGHAKSKPIADAATGQDFRIACLWSLPALLLIGQAHGAAHLVMALLLWAAALAFTWRLLRRRLQGFTGDTLGAVQQVCELALYLGLALR